VDFDAYLEMRGAFRKPNTVRNITLYNELCDMWDQLGRHLRRKDFGKQKGAEQIAMMQ
jgi:hypothetical protein